MRPINSAVTFFICETQAYTMQLEYIILYNQPGKSITSNTVWTMICGILTSTEEEVRMMEKKKIILRQRRIITDTDTRDHKKIKTELSGM